VIQVINGFEQGADAQLAKPFVILLAGQTG